jgi:hypothetical protein
LLHDERACMDLHMDMGFRCLLYGFWSGVRFGSIFALIPPFISCGISFNIKSMHVICWWDGSIFYLIMYPLLVGDLLCVLKLQSFVLRMEWLLHKHQIE